MRPYCRFRFSSTGPSSPSVPRIGKPQTSAIQATTPAAADHEQRRQERDRDAGPVGHRAARAASPEGPDRDADPECDAGDREPVDQPARQHRRVHHPVEEVEDVRDAARVGGRRAVLDVVRAGAEERAGVDVVQHVAPHADRDEPGDAADRRPSRACVGRARARARARIGSTSPVESFAPSPKRDRDAAERGLEAAGPSSRHAATTGNDAATRSFCAVVDSSASSEKVASSSAPPSRRAPRSRAAATRRRPRRGSRARRRTAAARSARRSRSRRRGRAAAARRAAGTRSSARSARPGSSSRPPCCAHAATLARW